MPSWCWCGSRASYNYKGLPPRFCGKHRQPGMANVIAPVCAKEECVKGAYFNLKGLPPLFCNEHKEPGMINVRNKKCAHENCNTLPNFNYDGQKSPLFCNEHKKLGMINVVSKKCAHEGCSTGASCNVAGRPALFCAKHKEPGMIDIMSKKCAHENCITQPNFNYDGQKSPLFCDEHKEPGMTNVVSKKCAHEDCSTRACCNIAGQLPLYCGKHKELGMIDVVSKKCVHEHCSTTASCNVAGQLPLYCAKHKKPGMIDVVSPRCQQCAYVHVGKQGDLCAGCDPARSLTALWVNAKCLIMMRLLCLRYDVRLLPEEYFERANCDVQAAACEEVARKSGRIDFVVDGLVGGSVITVCEVDEHYHKDYCLKAEYARTVAMTDSMLRFYGSEFSLVQVRINPDAEAPWTEWTQAQYDNSERAAHVARVFFKYLVPFIEHLQRTAGDLEPGSVTIILVGYPEERVKEMRDQQALEPAVAQFNLVEFKQTVEPAAADLQKGIAAAQAFMERRREQLTSNQEKKIVAKLGAAALGYATASSMKAKNRWIKAAQSQGMRPFLRSKKWRTIDNVAVALQPRKSRFLFAFCVRGRSHVGSLQIGDKAAVWGCCDSTSKTPPWHVVSEEWVQRGCNKAEVLALPFAAAGGGGDDDGRRRRRRRRAGAGRRPAARPAGASLCRWRRRRRR